MLEIKELASWQDFENTVKKELNLAAFHHSSRYPIFRGQSNADLHLLTTLDRLVGCNMSVENYFNLIINIQPKIETFTNQKWNLPSYEDFLKTIEYPSRIDIQTYMYMTYLRHFGFPSPFLDWTKSPFIAAYFAFRDVSNSSKSIAIYMYSVEYDAFSIPLSDFSRIFPIEKSPKNNKRHEFQQGVYTVCLKKEKDQIYFKDYEDAGITQEDRTPHVIKFILPASERVIALHSFQTYNISAYSLFGTEESLLESLFLERYILADLTKLALERHALEHQDNVSIDINGIWR